MKRNVPVLGALILALSSALAGARPAAEVTFKSFSELSAAINRVATAVSPNTPADTAQQLGALMGLTNLDALDTTHPWAFAAWYPEVGGDPLFIIKGPFTNLMQFKASLAPESFLRKTAKDWTQSEGGLGSIVLGETNHVSEGDLAEVAKWKAEAIQPPKKTIELDGRLSDPLRAQLKGLLSSVRESFVQTVTNQALAASGANPKAMADVFSAYFELFETFVNGFSELKLGLDATPDAIVVDELITAKPGSDLAKWMQPPANSITAADLTGIDPEASFGLAAYLGNSDSLVKLVKKFTALGLQMQNVETNDALSKDFDALFVKMLPMKFAGSASFKDQFTFSGAYSFPAGNAADAYAQVKALFNGSFKSQVGKDKLYSAATIAEKHHTVAGVDVDRVSLTLNLDNPMFQAPGQKEQLETLWPGGKMDLDYAIKDGRLFVASTSGSQMQDLLEGKFVGQASLAPENGTCLAGYVNLLELLKRFAQATGMLPDEMKAKLAKLDTLKTSIGFQMSLDNQMHATTRVPMKLIRELGRLQSSN